MTEHQFVLGVVPARGGSKGIPDKNLTTLAGRPLIHYTLEAAAQSRMLARTIVSTDSEEIARVARQAGADVPFLRPAELAGDTTPAVPVLLHAVEFVEREGGKPVDIVVMLQPTCPLRCPEDVDACVALLTNGEADSVISVSVVDSGSHPYYLYELDENGSPRKLISGDHTFAPRQQFPRFFRRNGAVYAVRRDVLVHQRTLYGAGLRFHVMPAERAVNIDSELDVLVAECLVARAARA